METGLAFAGGGIPGSAAVGVLLAFEEAGIKVSHVTGSSSGAMVAALYAYGHKAETLKRIVPRLNRRLLDFDWRSLLYRALFIRPRVDGILKGERLRNIMAQNTGDEPLSSLKIPCGIVATDYGRGTSVVFSSKPVEDYEYVNNTSIADAVRASFAIPVLFKPYHYEERMLIDGGVTSNCPVRICRALGAERVISVDPITPIINAKSGSASMVKVINNVINLSLKTQMEAEHKEADYTLYPEVGAIGAFDFRKAKHCIDLGYETAMANMKEIKKVLTDQEY
ncbi:patatin-like phospholipase family protein [Bacillus sp. FJAT-44742]|uniref:patatin-like phospholipase family protein n=1 Tax=Bacillus sp. FJAT-44742 TaxID=2014005 RepID=UPI000C23E5FD|nr:patatin-like phospholipase family protein [Bacillus sp. FJAT-44742]